jgi:hypothetical protein
MVRIMMSKKFDFKLQNQSTPESERSILMSKILMTHRIDQDYNPDVENFVSLKKIMMLIDVK